MSSASAADRWCRWAGVLTGVVAARFVGNAWETGGDVGVLYAVLVFGLCAVAGVLAGDLLTARPRGTVRTAALTPRRVRDYVPPRMTPFLVIQAGLLVVLLVVAAVLVGPGESSRAGDSLTFTCQDGGFVALGAWPGGLYGLPVVACVAGAAAVCVWSLTWIARRPGDDQSRQDRSLAVVAAWGLLVSALLLGIASTMSGALMGTTCDGILGRIGAGILWLTALIALVTVSWSIVTVLAPKARVRR
ncbi:hypothetical protein [Streptomyces sp. NPDC059861]|uniref:hypothetical protein n=1 Tax=Streptomyces sp. NPDC059861 TaxID=3346974 RepID=UPI003668D319